MDEIDLAADVAALFTEAAVESARHRDKGPRSTGSAGRATTRSSSRLKHPHASFLQVAPPKRGRH